MFCTKCGGELVDIGNGKSRCKFCRKEFTKEELKTEEVKSSVEVKSVSPKMEKLSGAEVYEKNIDGIAEIISVGYGVQSSGSGLLINKELGYILTNTHVVTHNAKVYEKIQVKIANETIPAKVLLLGDDNGGHGNGDDLALLKIDRVPTRAKNLRLGNFKDVKIGEAVFVIGNSLGEGTCITSGIVSDRLRKVNGKMLLMTDCAVNSGNSGGPIFNDNGLVIGVIVSSIQSAEGMNFAIPSDTVLKFLNSYSGSNVSQMSTTKNSSPRPANCPCPKCGSKYTIIQNDIFVCHNCGFEG